LRDGAPGKEWLESNRLKEKKKGGRVDGIRGCRHAVRSCKEMDGTVFLQQYATLTVIQHLDEL